MEKEDSNYQIMKYLDAPVGNIIPILQIRSDRLSKISVSRPPDFESVEDFQSFAKSYFKLLRVYSKFGVLNENIKKEHGRNVIERFKKILGEIKEPFEQLEEVVTQNIDSRSIRELGTILYGYSSSLGKCMGDFRTLMYREYRSLRKT